VRRVYVAGPYSSDPEGGTALAMDAADVLEDAGLCAFIPHLSHFRHLRRPRDYEHWMRVDFTWLRQCEALLRLPGESSGAEREVALAYHLGIPVFRAAADVIAWAKCKPRTANGAASTANEPATPTPSLPKNATNA
jgi:hypothetical protein